MQFPFVHPSIGKVLGSPGESFDRNLVEPQSLRIISNFTRIDLRTLAELARASDQVLSDTVTLRAPLQGMLVLCQQKQPAAATLLALNYLESAIRRRTGHTVGKAPLLKTMLEQLSDEEIGPILKSLLLPHDGLNLRNLLWHGFIGELPQVWFSLVMVIIFNLERDQIPQTAVKPKIPKLRSHRSIRRLLDDHPIQDFDLPFIRGWLPSSHQTFFDLVVQWREHYPACAAALMGVLLEHCLRLEWCRVNARPEDAIAQPSSYYVTLDGHGQRNQHDLILHPYYGEEQKQNQLVSELGGGMVALLTDLFASSCGGPNIRAALAHGIWDPFLDEELSCMLEGMCGRASNSELKDMVHIMLIALSSLANNSPISYNPLFSYTATTTRNLQQIFSRLEGLESHSAWSAFDRSIIEAPDAVLQLRVPCERLRQSIDKLQFIHLFERDSWTATDVFDEYNSNMELADCIAARALLSDLEGAIEAYFALLGKAQLDLQVENISSRQRKRATRLCCMLEATISLYSFSLHVAVGFLLGQPIGVKAVERSRMCVSTFATFLPTNAERALKAAAEFTKGKAVRAILLEAN